MTLEGFVFILFFAAVLYLCVRHTGWAAVGLVVVLVLFFSSDSVIVFQVAVTYFFALAAAGLYFALRWLGDFGGDVRQRARSGLHQHGDLWHDHPHERSHFHPHDVNGPFVYTDERVIDQRQED